MRRITYPLLALLIVFVTFYAFIVLPKLRSMNLTTEPGTMVDMDLTEKIQRLRAESHRLSELIDALSIGGDVNEAATLLHREKSNGPLKIAELPIGAKSNPAGVLSPSRHISTPTSISRGPPSILVVGGTDGSGTRRVVQLLTMLGARFVSEDPETFDIHADVVGGWPAIVNPVLEHTHSVIYDPITFPQQLQTSIATKITTMLNKAEADSTKPTSYKLAVGGALPLPTPFRASRVKYGFKAPVAMTVVPWLSHLLPHVMFLHVVRDGRDIAFSANQGPVDKFYKVMYGVSKKKEIKAEQAIRLWSDWNGGLVDYAAQRRQALQGREDKTFDSLVLKIEDLVSQDVGTRFAAMMELAYWIGSDADAESVCCMAVQGSTFMGSHDRTQRGSNSGESLLANRFGKWRKYFDQDKSLEPKLMAAGQSGLSKFGYLNNERGTDENRWGSCSLNIHQCGAKEKNDPNWRSVNAPQQRLTKSCSIMSGDMTMKKVAHEEDCCNSCKQYDGCHFFTFDANSKYCYLKSAKSKEISDASTIRLSSGSVI